MVARWLEGCCVAMAAWPTRMASCAHPFAPACPQTGSITLLASRMSSSKMSVCLLFQILQTRHPPMLPTHAPQGGAITSLAIGMQRSGFALKGLPPLRFCVCFAGIRCAPTGVGRDESDAA